MIDTFSANSIRVLEESTELFKKKFIYKSELIEKNEETKAGNKFHRMIFYYLKGYDIKKFENALLEGEALIWERFKNSEIIKSIFLTEKKFIEQPFFVKLENTRFYLTGRFDVVIKNGENFEIIDWKMRNIPKNPEAEIQTLVYFYSASKLFGTKNLKMRYYSLEKNEGVKIPFIEDNKRLRGILSKLKAPHQNSKADFDSLDDL